MGLCLKWISSRAMDVALKRYLRVGKKAGKTWVMQLSRKKKTFYRKKGIRAEISAF